MKKLLLLITFLIISCNLVFADGDLWDNFGDSNVYGQQAVSDEDFENALKSKQKKKKKDKNALEGESFSQSNETNLINDTSKELPVLLIPLNLKINEKYTIPIGHYQVEGEKVGNEVFIKLYQAHDLIAKLSAEETNEDFEEEAINFVKLNPHGDYHVMIIYGGLDFNAYTIIDIE